MSTWIHVGDEHEDIFHMVLRLKFSPKVATFMWKIMHNIPPTRDNFHKRGIISLQEK